MAESWTPRDDDPATPSDGEGYAEELPVEDDQPRRAASARFDVAPTVGTEAAMRDAMDPANQSLGDALRLSYRILQVVIVLLIALFLASGFQAVQEGQTGVLTVWGKKVAVGGEEALQPGLHMSVWPYPVAEFVLFPAENRTADSGEAFWPFLGGKTFAQASTDATVGDQLNPSRDGSLLTREGDLVHMKLLARYEINNPSQYVDAIVDQDADRLVRLTLQRAAVSVVGTMSLSDVVDSPQSMTDGIRQSMQRSLDALACGIQVTDVSTPQTPTPPLAIAKLNTDVQDARNQAKVSIDDARDKARQSLVRTAGPRASEVLTLIESYEVALETNDELKKKELLAAISTMLDSPDISGEVSEIIQQAKAYQSQIESSLGNEARRFLSVLPSYRQHPELFVRERWLAAYGRVVARADAEPLHVPFGVGNLVLKLTGSDDVQQTRRRLYLQRKEDEANRRTYDPLRSNITRGADMTTSGPGRQLKVKDGKVVPSSSGTGGSQP